MTANDAVAPEATRLAPGARVRPWTHHFAPWDLAARVALHDGVARTGARLTPRGPARPPSAEECALLDGVGRPGEPALEVFTTPALLREHFWALDPDELPGGEVPADASKLWQGFVADVRAFVKQVRAPLPAAHALLLAVREGEAEAGLWENGPGRALLERDRGNGHPASDGPAYAAHVNLGDSPTALVFWNVPLLGMAAMLRQDGLAAPPADALALVRAFAERFPRCPLVRLTLAPGDGVLVPLVGIAHDLDASGATDLDVVLSLVPGPNA